MVLVWLLLWGTLTSLLEADPQREKCPPPNKIPFAKYTAESYLKGSQLAYRCNKGYIRRQGSEHFIECKNHSGHLEWNTFECFPTFNENGLPTEQPPSTPHEWLADGANDPPKHTDHCRAPPEQKHAKPWENMVNFYPGQKLQYKCNKDYKSQSPLPAESICKRICGKLKWTTLNFKCIHANDSDPSPPLEPGNDHTTEYSTDCPLITTSGPTDTEKMATSTVPVTKPTSTTNILVFFSTLEHQIAVAVCACMLIMVIFLGWITWRRWGKRSGSGKSKPGKGKLGSASKNGPGISEYEEQTRKLKLHP
ncbi:interleukin-2 receptor subunit alpha isoform X2 [Ornithorhynchus anatinus]|uniref:interleukin-2 receptor subunit alpha isoform X2 n=1 Tax=Ornithorhynchus anatinus TaxID=9258 RepID=UPI0004543497|nr:interleukin-2 receptor subunit alpha isoform X2 [Ornithorhynchus anatinus]